MFGVIIIKENLESKKLTMIKSKTGYQNPSYFLLIKMNLIYRQE